MLTLKALQKYQVYMDIYIYCYLDGCVIPFFGGYNMFITDLKLVFRAINVWPGDGDSVLFLWFSMIIEAQDGFKKMESTSFFDVEWYFRILG